MKQDVISIMAAIALLLAVIVPVTAQSGGDFVLTQTVIAGGGSQSTAGGFTLDATIGQPDAGARMGYEQFAITSGFWNYTSLAPTAAGVSISGRIVSPNGGGVSNARLLLQTQNGEIFVSRSASFGYYIFENIAAGQVVFVTVEHKLFVFEPRTVTVIDSVVDLDFTGQPL